ncbi:hypothetical protein BC936DRAFT_149526 [Jimgerdemannia flammicorona]|uniref:Uncharacterized protein n=1 Tax=Jimgerdemannia flammicorona TaxID=994334 RepID=A0A433DN12_9FUNG|nr:hypothetical protein BC936DRAFT_149526 [Jimgerdemannia flammicorona]
MKFSSPLGIRYQKSIKVPFQHPIIPQLRAATNPPVRPDKDNNTLIHIDAVPKMARTIASSIAVNGTPCQQLRQQQTVHFFSNHNRENLQGVGVDAKPPNDRRKDVGSRPQDLQVDAQIPGEDHSPKLADAEHLRGVAKTDWNAIRLSNDFKVEGSLASINLEF